MQLLVAPAAFTGTLRASEVAAAVGEGLEAAGLEPPDLCPLADGGAGTLEVLLTRLGGETAAARVADPGGRPRSVSFALLEGGSTALVEAAAASGTRLAPGAAGTRGTGELVVAALEAGAEVVVVAAGGALAEDRGAGAVAAVEAAGGLHGGRLLVLTDLRRPGGLAVGLRAGLGAELRSGAQFVLDAVDFDARMRAAWALIVGAGRLDRSSLEGSVAGEAATRARQAGVPAHAIVGENALSRFDARILDLQHILTAPDRAGMVAAGAALAERLAGPTH